MKSLPCLLRFVVAIGLAFTAAAQVRADNTASVAIGPIPTIGPGGTIPITCTVTNPGAAATFQVATEIQQNGSVPTTQTNNKYPLPVAASPGTPGSVMFHFTVPSSGWPPGTYTVHAVLRDETNTTWLGEGFQTFSVQDNPAFSGRIAYHVYSSYLALPPVKNTDGTITDGTIQLYPLPAGPPINITGSVVQNAVNPKFSPDGTKIVFAGVPLGAHAGHASLAVFLYDLADNTCTQLTTNPNNSTPAEDPNFSPDGTQIVFKNTPGGNFPPKQIWIMNLDGSGQGALTATPEEKSGPVFWPDGHTVAYFSGSTQTDPKAMEIWTIPFTGNIATPSLLFQNNDLETYYPNYRDSNTLLYTQWAGTGDTEDKIYEYFFDSKTSSQPLLTNMSATDAGGYNDSDSFPVTQAGTTLIGFSSTRPQPNTGQLGDNGGGYILYLGDTTTGTAYYLPYLDPNTRATATLNAEGGTYSPLSYARKLVMVAPSAGTTLGAGTTTVLQVKAWSNGGVWSGASPAVTFQGPETDQYVQLHDDGLDGDLVAGDGIYSATVKLPATNGSYTVSAAADSIDNGTRSITSAPLTITVLPAQTVTGFPIPQTLGEDRSPYVLPASTSAGQTITYQVLSGPASVSGDTLTLNGTGTVMLQATADGNANYAPYSFTETITVAATVPATSKWMLAFLAVLLCFVAGRALGIGRA